MRAATTWPTWYMMLLWILPPMPSYSVLRLLTFFNFVLTVGMEGATILQPNQADPHCQNCLIPAVVVSVFESTVYGPLAMADWHRKAGMKEHGLKPCKPS